MPKLTLALPSANALLLSLTITGSLLAGCQQHAAPQNNTSPANQAASVAASSQAGAGTQATNQPQPDNQANLTNQANVANGELPQTLAANLKKSGIDTQVQAVSPTPLPNLYRVKAEGLPPFFTDSSGQYVIQGDIVKVGGEKIEHTSDDLLAADAKTALAGIDKKDMVIFPAKGETKAVINVFTDVDCGYCRKLHSEINEINARGIEVRYLPWPRSEASEPIMEKVWCSQDRNAALTQAKQGNDINAPSCTNPVRRLHALGAGLGITGTPAIFTQDGHQIGGYLPAAQLAAELGVH